MTLRNFAINVDDSIYQQALQLTQQEGKTLEQLLVGLIIAYTEGETSIPQTYIVQPGDSLIQIARKIYGDPYQYRVIQNANNLGDSSSLRVGQELIIPPIAGGKKSPTSTTPSPTPKTPPTTSPPTPTTPPPVPPEPPSSTEPTLKEYVQAMEKGFQADKSWGLNVTYQFQLRSSKGTMTWTVAVVNQTVSINPGQSATPTVIIQMSEDDFIMLSLGKLNAVQAYQQGRFRVQGDLYLAARVPELFGTWGNFVDTTPTTPPSQPKIPSQPKTPTISPPDPRPSLPPAQPTLADYVRAMAPALRRDRTGGLQISFQFQLSGSGGNTWTVQIANQTATVIEGATPSPTVIIQMSGADFIELSQGRLNTVQSYYSGRIRIYGDVKLAARIPDLFGTWGTGLTTPGQPSEPPATPTPPTIPTSPPPSSGEIYSSLLNGSFDEYQPYIRGDEGPKEWKEAQFPERYGAYWTLDLISEHERRIHLMDSGTFGRFTQKYFGGGGRDYHIHGHHSQVVTSRYGFDLLFRQTVKAEPGRTYIFRGSIVSFYKGTSGEQAHGKIFKTLGLDPTGGQNWHSPAIIWGERDGTDNQWRYPSIRAMAQANAITVFIRLENVEKDVGRTELNIIHLDNFKLE